MKLHKPSLGRAIETAFRECRYAFRSLKRSPGFSTVVVVTLALGIGTSLTMFGLVRAVLWRPLPYPEPNRIVTMQVDARNVSNVGATEGEVFDLRKQSRSLEYVSTINAVDANLEYAGEMNHLTAASISDDFLPLLGANPTLGRTLDSRIDENDDRVLAVLISNELWRRQFSADPGIIGKGVRINNLDVQIVGVLQSGFRLFLPPSVSAQEQIDVWFPSRISPAREYRGTSIVARLKAGVTLDQTNAELQTLAAQFEKEYPAFYSGAQGWQASPFDVGSAGGKLHLTVRLLHDEITRDARSALFLLSGAVGFVLLIACVNVANLMLARGAARLRELEIRRALGAGRFQIARQILTESLILAAVAAAIGLFTAHFGLAAIGRVSASHIPMQSRIGIDAPVGLFAVALSLMTSVLFGLLPAWRLASGETNYGLRAGRAETAGSGSRKLQRTLVAAEVALSIVPLVSGGLMLRSFLNLLHSPLGFDPANVVTVKVPINLAQYPKIEQQWAVLRDIVERVRTLPGVQSVSAAEPLPLAGQDTRRVGRSDRPDTPPILATQQSALPGYLRVIGTPLLEGRDFTDDDIVRQHAVTIIDASLARRLWPEGALGKRLTVYRTGQHQEFEVIGVTSPVRVTRVRDDNIPHFVMPYSDYDSETALVIKTTESADRMAPQIKRAVDAAHGGRAAYDILPMSRYVWDSIGDTRFILSILGVFAAASLLLAAIGVYGTLAYLTAQRSREFGIRLALGSSANAIFAIVVRESFLLTIVGTAVGLVGVAAATGAIRGLLYGVQPLDGTTLFCVAGLMGLVALLAASVPAVRAARTDPQVLLRTE